LGELVFLSSQSFVLKEIKVKGNQKLSYNLIMSNFPWEGQNIFLLPYDAAAKLFRSFTEVKNIGFEIKIPSTLIIKITERIPAYYFLQIPGHKLWFKVDAEGMVLERMSGAPLHDLPRVRLEKDLTIGEKINPEVINDLFIALTHIPTELKSKITYFIFDRNLDFSFEYSFLQHFMVVTLGDANNFKGKMLVLERILNWLKEQNKPLSGVDLSTCVKNKKVRLYFLDSKELPSDRFIP
jgi:hypothetical protein